MYLYNLSIKKKIYLVLLKPTFKASIEKKYKKKKALSVNHMFGRNESHVQQKCNCKGKDKVVVVVVDNI